MTDPQAPADPQRAPEAAAPEPRHARAAAAPEPQRASEPEPRPAPASDPSPPSTLRDVEYKGAPLDAAKGPGLGCFWLQLAAVAVLVVLTPLSVGWGWPEAASAVLLLATLVLLLFAGQTVIFLLRLVAADRRAELRRAPLASRTRTVGQLEDQAAAAPPAVPPQPAVQPAEPPEPTASEPPPPES